MINLANAPKQVRSGIAISNATLRSFAIIDESPEKVRRQPLLRYHLQSANSTPRRPRPPESRRKRGVFGRNLCVGPGGDAAGFVLSRPIFSEPAEFGNLAQRFGALKSLNFRLPKLRAVDSRSGRRRILGTKLRTTGALVGVPAWGPEPCRRERRLPWGTMVRSDLILDLMDKIIYSRLLNNLRFARA